MPLTDAEIRHGDESKIPPYTMFDGRGLHLLVKPKPSGKKLWRYAYRFQGKPRLMALGEYPLVSLKDAREAHSKAHKLWSNGIDPMAQKKEVKREAKAAKADSFATLALAWFDHWKGDKDERNIRTTENRLKNHVLARKDGLGLGNRAVETITKADVRDLVKKIEKASGPEMASRCYQLISQIFKWAIDTDRAESNPANMKRGNVLSKRKREKRNFPSLPLKEMPVFLRALEITAAEPLTRLAMRLLALTAMRTNEVIGLQWADVDEAKRVITIPAERMKAGQDFVIPLSTQALQVLSKLRELHRHLGYDTEFVFPGQRGAQTMSNGAFLMFIRHAGFRGRMTGHGFRSVFSTWAHEQTGTDHQPKFDWRMVESCLAHAIKGQVEIAYNSAKYIEPRRAILQAWADTLDDLEKK